MQFAFDERQDEFRAQLRALAEKLCPPAELRAAWESPTGWSADRWRALSELGVTGLTVPEAHDGLGLGFVDLVLLLEEAGRSGLPEPLLDTVAVGVPLLATAAGSPAEALAAQWLPRVAAGDAALGVADPARPHLVGAGTQLLLVWRHGTLVALSPEAARVRERRSVDRSRHLWEIDLSGAEGTVVADGELADGLARETADRGAVAAGAVLVGVADRLITMAAAYAKERAQFGKPIGSFQAVKHHLAGAFVRLEFARPVVYRAAWSLDQGEPTITRDASMAKAMASDAATLAARVALQVHGAIGYTWEHDLHLWMTRAWSLAASWGDAAWHRAQVLEHLAGSTTHPPPP